jgi:CrcB protein
VTPYLLVGIGGALGAMLRYGYGSLVGRLWPSDFPHGTMVINIVGSLAMGVLVGILARTLPAGQDNIRLFVAVGVLGGFTTFSTFSLDAIVMIERGQILSAVLYILGSVVIGILALYVGLILTRGAPA